MKYFTPDRFVALQNFSSDAAMDAADATWEQAVQQYEASLQTVLPKLPASVRQLAESQYLHDAEVLSMGRQGGDFTIMVQLDLPPHELVTISYALAGEPMIDQEALPPHHRSSRPLWLYEELELVEGAEEHFRHSILLSNGWELRLPFRLVQVTTAQPLYPVHRPMTSAQSA